MTSLIPSFVQGYLLDMDGTFYIGDRLLPGALEFIDRLRSQNTPFLFLTNNSSKDRFFYKEKLCGFGIEVSERQILTSGQVAAEELRQVYRGGKAAVLGNQFLVREFESAGFMRSDENPDLAVLGYDDQLTYDRLAWFCGLVRDRSIPYYATHADIVCPSREGFLPDAGAFLHAVALVTGRSPEIVFGKPNLSIIKMAASTLDVPAGHLAMVGDRLYTDIAMRQHGVFTVLSLTGESQLTDLENSAWKPHLIIQDLRELV